MVLAFCLLSCKLGRLYIWEDLGSNPGSNCLTLPRLITLSQYHFCHLTGFVRIDWEYGTVLVQCLTSSAFDHAACLKNLSILPSRMWGQACSSSGHILFFMTETGAPCLKCFPCPYLHSVHCGSVMHPFPLVGAHLTVYFLIVRAEFFYNILNWGTWTIYFHPCVCLSTMFDYIIR